MHVTEDRQIYNVSYRKYLISNIDQENWIPYNVALTLFETKL